MKNKNILSGRIVRVAVLIFFVGLFFTACLNEAERSSNEGIKKSQDGLYGEAIEEFNRSISLDPKNPIPYYMRGYVYAKLAMYEEAILDLNKTIELDPNDPDAFFSRGNMYRRLDENESAIADYTRAIELNPNNPDCLHNRGLLLGEMWRLEDSIKDLREACRLGNQNSCIALERAMETKRNKRINK
jgi:Flp pilus assembly protein TadD